MVHGMSAKTSPKIDETPPEEGATSWIDRLTPEEVSHLDPFDARMLLDELEWRRERAAKLEQEKSVATAGALLVAGAARGEAVEGGPPLASASRFENAVAVLEATARGLGTTIAADLARTLGPRLREIMRPVQVPPDDAYVDQDAGLFDRDTYLKLARSGAIPNKKVGHKRVARWADVKAAFVNADEAITTVEPTDDPEADLLDEIRQRAGLKVKGRR